MSEVYSLERAGRWFLDSGIQEPSGGVARFYLADSEKNKPVSTEITGYAASALAFLYCITKEDAYLDAARRAAHFLTDQAWDPALSIFPYEHSHSPIWLTSSIPALLCAGCLPCGASPGSRNCSMSRLRRHRECCGISTRGATSIPSSNCPRRRLAIAIVTGLVPLRCYQAKSALAWREVAEITGEASMRAAYFEMIAVSLEPSRDFLPGTDERPRVMDRLHAASYFLEALSPVLDRDDSVAAYRYTMDRITLYLRNIAPEFARSDVYAQLLRARIYAAAVIPIDRDLAREEAEALAVFQRPDGGFWFGRRAGQMIPHVNPVSTAFAIQALEVWQALESGSPNPCPCPTI